ncbi:MAG: MATE family efflux transporter [bacterium]|nr:MATE family efflux transporter [bacterium]
MLRTRPPRHIAEIIHGPLNGTAVPGFTREIKRAMMKSVLSMGLPSMTGFLVMTLYEIVDMFWLARIGPEPVAAVTLCTSFIWMLAFSNMIIGPGSLAMISRRFGEGDLPRTELAIKNMFVLKFLFGLLFGLPVIPALPWVLDFLGASAEVQRLGVIYGTAELIMLGVAMTGYSVYTALRSIGKPVTALWLQIITTVVNCVFDPLLIFGIGPFPRLGILGAVLATAFAQLLVVILGLYALALPSSPVRVRWLHGRPFAAREMIQMLRIGLPAGINQLSFALATSLLVKIVAGYGTGVIAVYGICVKVMHFGIMAIAGLGLGTGALIGQYLGSKELHKAWLSAVLSIRLAGWIMIGYAVFLLAGAPLLVKAFFDDPALHQSGTIIIQILALSLPAIGIHIGAEIVFEGAGQNTPPMVLALIHAWVVMVPFLYLTGPILGGGPYAIMAALVVAHALGGAAALWLFYRGTWLRHEV